MEVYFEQDLPRGEEVNEDTYVQCLCLPQIIFF